MITYNGKNVLQTDVHGGDKYREAYLNSVNRFIEKKYKETYSERESFMTPEALVESPEKYRKALLDMLGSPVKEYPTNIPAYEKEYVGTDDFSDIYRMKIEVMDDFYFYGMLLMPKGMSGKAPLIVAQHGGGSLPEICTDMNGPSVYCNFAQRALERGMVVFVPQILVWRFDMNTGENRVAIDLPYRRDEVDNKLKNLGLSITGLEIFCIRRSIDCLANEDFIDSDRIGMMGLSYGGYFTLYTAALDTRIKSAYAAGFFNNRTKKAFGDWSYKNFLNTFSDAEACGLVAPRKLQIDVGSLDAVFDFTYAPKEAERAKSFFKAFGKEENFRFSMWRGGHTFDSSGEGFEFFFSGI